MGIPVFYRWLTENYPCVVVNVIEDTPEVINGFTAPIDTTKPNPNGLEFDNLYLDMNGIIHPCFHPERGPSPKSYDEVLLAVFMYIDRIFSLIRPRKLLFLAIDGVAPRAKMNQQRSRRFRAAKETADAASRREKRGGGSAKKGTASVSTRFDSNIITPGTEFMELLSSALQFYIHLRMNHDPAWQGIKVILSDASVPGEGEHKVMSYIRLQRNLPGFDPNTRHCLYGLDADLIMLALASHEVHFSVLREAIVNGRFRSMNKKGAGGNLKPREGPSRYLEDVISRQRFQFLHAWVIRDYLAEVLRVPDATVKVDLERLIDDFIFMCLFVGNDFLPHLPSLDISEGAIELLLFVYKHEFIRMGGYLTDSSEVNLERVAHFVRTLATHEDAIFKKRSQSRKDRSFIMNAVYGEDSFVADKVHLGEDGWKERYYAEKFKVQTDDDCERIQKHAVLKYAEGICWVMHYYYQGVCSWQWFYPYHYAPFASDFHGLDELKVNFVLGEPFKPLNQLMAVLPAASKLMTDPSSPILDFYPTEFERDLNGKKRAWKAVCRLPFIDEHRLLTEIAKVEHKLTDKERRRNTLGLDKLFIHLSYPLATNVVTFMLRNKEHPKLHIAKLRKKIKPELCDGMNGYMYISDKPICPAEISSPMRDMPTITENKVVSVFYKVPHFHPHISRPPQGVIMPQKSITNSEVRPPPALWHQTPIVQITQQSLRNVNANKRKRKNSKKRKRNAHKKMGKSN